MAGLRRVIYGMKIMGGYRRYRVMQLAQRSRPHPMGFQFAGADTFFSSEWEPWERSIIAGAMPDTDLFVDIGANQGIYTCLVAFSGMPVVAIEPEIGNQVFLKANVVRNRLENVEIFPIALSDRVGIMSLYGDGDLASLVGGWHGVARSFSTLVPTNTLDNLLARRAVGQRLFIKVDVEGAEAAVLKGAVALLASRPRPMWLIETFPRRPDSHEVNPDFMRIFSLMYSLGYSCVGQRTNGAVLETDLPSFMEMAPSPRGWNFLFR